MKPMNIALTSPLGRRRPAPARPTASLLHCAPLYSTFHHIGATTGRFPVRCLPAIRPCRPAIHRPASNLGAQPTVVRAAAAPAMVRPANGAQVVPSANGARVSRTALRGTGTAAPRRHRDGCSPAAPGRLLAGGAGTYEG